MWNNGWTGCGDSGKRYTAYEEGREAVLDG